MHSDILIIGGGMSGLSLATRLHAAGRDVHLVEARDRLGGRILSKEGFDLGPAWFWPGQPRMAALIRQLGLRRFDQYAQGALTFEDADGRVERGRGFASMEGSWRVKGGLGALIAALARHLPQGRIHLSTPVTAIARSHDAITVTSATGASFTARSVVLAIPPRVASGLRFSPGLPDAAQQAMTATPTWMAGQAKAVAIYDRPFWRDAGLSGDAISRRGPLAEIHDASPHKGGPYALFGFVGVPPQARADGPALKAAIRAQLARLFGAEAATPTHLIVKDWAADPFTATTADQAPLYAHPRYGLPQVLSGLWDGRLLFSGSETAPTFGGFLEGALEAADATLATLTKDHKVAAHDH